MARRETAGSMKETSRVHGQQEKTARKQRRSFAETLSSEAQAAIRSAKEENKTEKLIYNDDTKDADDDKQDNNNISKVDLSCKLEDIYPKFVSWEEDEAPLMIHEDRKMIIPSNIIRTAHGHIRAIDGGKLNNAMETVEVVIAQDSDDDDDDDGGGGSDTCAAFRSRNAVVDTELDSELRLAAMQRASTQKCLVWLEANHRIEQTKPQHKDSEQ